MSSATGKCSLFLCPGQYDFAPEDISSFITALQNIGLISKKIDASEGSRFYSGDNFLDYIAYMGCSPAIQFEASNSSKNFCHIKVHLEESPRLIFSQKQTRAPHCPHCKKPVKSWALDKTGRQIFCDHCNTTASIEEFNWRKMAGYARFFIEITDIFPKEAIPQQLLLDKLKQIFGVDWLYFYACE